MTVREPPNGVLSVSGIVKRFGSVTALNDVSLTIPPNVVFGVLGPNGAGKTTLFSVITGFVPQDRGTIEILGERTIEKVKGKIGILPQDALFQSNIPIIDQLNFFLTLSGYSGPEAEEEVLRVLRLVELDTVLYREAATLSHGMYKRLALAQAFLGDPEILILDEPTSGLDWKSAKKIRQTIKNAKHDRTILVSSHNMKEMQELCDYIAVLDRGTIAAVGPVDEVTGTAYSLTVIVSRDLTDTERALFNRENRIYSLQQTGEKTYRLLFSADADNQAVEEAVGRFQKLLLDHGITLRSMQEDNRIEELYLKTVMPTD